MPAGDDRVEQVGKFGKIYHVSAPKAIANSSYRVLYPLLFLSAKSKIQKILAAERPDLIEICDKYTLNYLGAMLRIGLVRGLSYRPVVVGSSQERMDDNVRTYFPAFLFSRKFCSLYMRWLYFPFFDHHIANSEYTAAELRGAARAQLVPRATWILPMGVDLSDLSSRRRCVELRRRLLQNFGAGEDGVLLMYAGRLVPEKNLHLLFELLARLVKDPRLDYRLLVVGDGIERERWERKCEKEMAGRACFLGHVRDRSVLADLYANADVFVHPNAHEPFGIAPLEAMASGLPLVAPNCGGVVSYANSDNAWTVDADVESFASAVREAATNKILAAEKIRKAVATADRYSWNNVAPAFFELYEGLSCEYALAGSAQLPPTAFWSTPAEGLEAATMRGVAGMAKSCFDLCSRIAAEVRTGRSSAAPKPAADRRAAFWRN